MPESKCMEVGKEKVKNIEILCKVREPQAYRHTSLDLGEDWKPIKE